MSKRSKSLGRQGKGVLPPVTNGDDRRPSNPKNLRTVSRSNADLPSTSNPTYFINGRPSPYNALSSATLGARSIFAKKPSTYGRSENTEALNDVRDQLFEAKKKISELIQKNKVLNTQLNRVKRESERREAHLQNIMAGRFQPAELNDTHLAMTLTSLEQQRIENEQIINAQAERIRILEGKIRKVDEEGNEEDISDFEDDSLQESESSGFRKTAKVPEKWMDKHRRKLEIAKAHIEQNKELKDKIKTLSSELQQHKLRLKEVKPSAAPRVTTGDVNRIMDRIQENGLLRQQVDAATKQMRIEIQSKEEEIQTLKEKLEKSESQEPNEEVENLKAEKQELEQEREEMRKEHVLRELEKEQLSNEISELEEERRTLDEERNEWVKTKQAYEKVQITLEREMRQMEEVIENLRKDNALLRKKLDSINGHPESQVGNHVSANTTFVKEQSPPRPDNIPRLDMRDMSNDFTSPDSLSVNSHVSQRDHDESQWDERVSYLNDCLLGHLIRQDALATAIEDNHDS